MREGLLTSNQLWTVAAYYNPVGYKRRLENFQAFRRNLQAPLLVVELAKPGAHQLGEDDADIVVSLTGEDRIWQKERLINIGVARLPADVRYVAWVDADLIFDDPDWPAATVARLDEHGGAVQLFDAVAHLPKDFDARSATADVCRLANPILTKIAYPDAVRRCPSDTGGLTTSALETLRKSATHGKAWAARRDVIGACGHFDKAIVGGATVMHVKAAFGALDSEFLLRYGLPARFRAAAHAWAEGARRAGLFDHVSSLSQRAYHLWHGDIADRAYLSRYQILSRHDFDPDRDLELAPNGTWRWTDPEGALAADVAAYFYSRREDGTA